MLSIILMNAAKLLLAIVCVLPFPIFASETSVKVLQEINLARTAPQQYADTLAQRMAGVRTRQGQRSLEEAVAFLRKASPLPPLSYSEGMASGALRHVEDQGSKGTFGHQGSDRSNPWDRMSANGKWTGCAGENISYGYDDPGMIVATLIVDDGVRGRGHRKNIFNRSFAVAGIACGPHARYREMCVIDFAGGFVENGVELPGGHRSIASAWTREGVERL
jgi:uncharacterized protein YkwD